MANLSIKESNLWNPFESTSRDLDRTDELSQKNPIVAGVLSWLFLPAGMIYLNRGVNSLKIIGYVFFCAFISALISDSEEQACKIAEGIGYAGGIAATIEQVNTVNKARQRRSQYGQGLD